MLLGAVAFLVVLVVLNRFAQPVEGGPLARSGRFIVETHTPGGVGTWGVSLPRNSTGSDIVLESIEPAAPVVGLAIIDIVTSDLRNGSVGTLQGYPPLQMVTSPVNGTAITTAAGSRPAVQILIGYRLSGRDDGSITGLKIIYTHDGQRFSTVLDVELVVHATSP